MCASRRGFTLIEVVVLIVVIGIAMAGVLLIFQNTVGRSADPQISKQSLAIAEAMLDEILLTAYVNDGPPASGKREDFNEVSDYAGYSTTGVKDIKDVAVPGLDLYDVLVAVATQTLSGSSTPPPAVPDVTESKRVTVTVTYRPTNTSVSLDGYRLKYAP